MDNKPAVLFLLFEKRHAVALERYWRDRPDERARSLVIAMAVDVEMKLRECAIDFVSCRKYVQYDPTDFIAQDKIISAVFSSIGWDQLSYRGVSLHATFAFAFRLYLHRVWYYSNILISIVDAHPSIRRFVVFAQQSSLLRADIFNQRETDTVIECTETVAAAHEMEVTFISPSYAFSNVVESCRRATLRIIFLLLDYCLLAWNAFIKAAVRSKRPRLLTDDYWRNIEPTIVLLPEFDCFILHKTEVRRIYWKMLLKRRIQFVDIANFIGGNRRHQFFQANSKLSRVWHELRGTISPVFVLRGHSFDQLLLKALDKVFGNIDHICAQIDAANVLFDRVEPDALLLRASASAHTKFAVLALTASIRGIPCIEVQHGLEYLGPGSASREHNAEYLATYGPLVSDELRALGYSPEKIFDIGSPRFDRYQKGMTRKSNGLFTVLCVVPEIHPYAGYDSYCAENFLTAVAEAAAKLNTVHVIVKIHPGSRGESLPRQMSRRAFAGVSYSIEQKRPLSEIFPHADIMVSCYSTAILEAMQCGLPVVVAGMNPLDAYMTRFHFSRYRDAGALSIAHSGEELSDVLTAHMIRPESARTESEAAQAFLKRNFSFDGNSSRRLADLIKELASQKKTK